MKQSALVQMRSAASQDVEWSNYLDSMLFQSPPFVGAHLAVFVEPFLSYVLNGSKTIESRFSLNRCDPFGAVESGDVVLLKETAGPVVGICRVSAVWSYVLDSNTLDEIRQLFAPAMMVDDQSFWDQRSDAAFATLMQIESVMKFEPFEVDKRDRRGWVVLKRRSTQMMLWKE